MLGARTRLLVRRELYASLSARWFYVYSAAFLLGGLLLATFGLQNTVVYGYRGFAKAFAGLVHLALLFVPLMALFPAAASVAEERESGALEYILAQPTSYAEVFAGKWGGLVLALALSLTFGFGAAGAVAAVRGVPPGLILTLYGFVLLLALCFISLGLCFSVAAQTRARALTLGFVAWLLLVALGTLGIIVAFIRWGAPEQLLAIWTFVNPVEAFRIGVIGVLDADLSLLGPVGSRIIERLGSGGATGLAAFSLAAWSLGPGLLGLWLFRRAR
ncbi:MAG: ABC transporter permease subunit [Gemmatimonadota bacterium]|nr:MAG: ABC transporter permease subunit [Gemmatimonadota bacterium]